MNNELKFSFYAAAAFSIWLMIEHLTGLNTVYFEKGIVFRLLAGFIPWVFIFAGTKHRKLIINNGTITFFEALRSGLVIAFLSSLLIALILWLYVNFMNTQMNQLAIAYELKKLQAYNYTSQEMEELITGIKRMYNGSVTSHLSLAVFFTSTGVLIAAVSALFLRTRK